MPKGFMSRDQFSQLMLVYTGMAADIAEIFEAFRESKVTNTTTKKDSNYIGVFILQVMVNSHLTYAILAVWNLSLTQFCLSIGATHKSRKTMKYVLNIFLFF